jgi:hypothetical protein
MLTTLLLIGNDTDKDVLRKVKSKATPFKALRVSGGLDSQIS